MSASKAHPHIDQPSEAQLRRLIRSKPPAMRQLYLDTHRLVLETLPDVVYAVDAADGGIGYGARQYGYNGWGMAAVTPYTDWISLGFIRGTALDDPDRVLEGRGATVRHVKLRSLEQLAARRHAIQRLLEAAAGLRTRQTVR